MYEISVSAREEEIEEFGKSWKDVKIKNGKVKFNIPTDGTKVTVDGWVDALTNVTVIAMCFH